MGGQGSGGHNRKSLQEHFLDGTYRRDRHGPLPEGLVSPAFNLKPARWLPTAAKRYFRELAPELVKLGTLDKLTLSLFEVLCIALARVEETGTILAEEGESIKGKPHPLLSVHRQYTNLMLKLSREFGMTPRSRLRLEKQEQDTPDDPLGKLLNLK